MSGVQPVFRKSISFNSHVTVFRFVDNYANERKGKWMRAAVDRHRFRRRIQQTELSLGDIFSESHRLKMSSYVNKNMKT